MFSRKNRKKSICADTIKIATAKTPQLLFEYFRWCSAITDNTRTACLFHCSATIISLPAGISATLPAAEEPPNIWSWLVFPPCKAVVLQNRHWKQRVIKGNEGFCHPNVILGVGSSWTQLLTPSGVLPCAYTKAGFVVSSAKPWSNREKCKFQNKKTFQEVIY